MLKRILTILYNYRVEIFGLGAAIFLVWLLSAPKVKPIVTNPTPEITQVEVPKITEKVVVQYVQDPKQTELINQLLVENKKLKHDIIGLSTSRGTLSTTGGVGVGTGVVERVPTELSNDKTVESSTEPRVMEYRFHDYQLDAHYTADGTRFNYDLLQNFIVTTLTDKNKDGKQTTYVSLAQDTPEGTKVVPMKTVEIVRNPTTPSWFFTPRIQGGVGVDITGSKSGVGVMQWLRFGTTKAAEDTKFSVASVGVGPGGLTMLPISVNLGQIKHSPFTNIWLSPSINLNKTVGVALTATF